MISYEEFLIECQSICSSFEGQGELEMYHYDRNHGWRHSDVNKIEKPRLYVQWSTGGVSGGSCWDSSDPQPYTNNEPAPELGVLDKVLEHFHSQLSFLQYRDLTARLLKSDGYSVGEYYGNSTDYQYKEVDLRELYNYLVEKNFIKDE